VFLKYALGLLFYVRRYVALALLLVLVQQLDYFQASVFWREKFKNRSLSKSVHVGILRKRRHFAWHHTVRLKTFYYFIVNSFKDYSQGGGGLLTHFLSCNKSKTDFDNIRKYSLKDTFPSKFQQFWLLRWSRVSSCNHVSSVVIVVVS
jgi:hypothetical protein